MEIMKPIDEVKSILFDFSTCDKWHPFVEYTEFKGGHVHHNGGAVRKCGFYKELKEKGIPEYVWEELVDVSHDQAKSIAFIQEENRPGIMDYNWESIQAWKDQMECHKGDHYPYLPT